MHKYCVCWDPDIPVPVCEYLANSLNETCIRLFCPYCAADNHASDIMHKLEDRIRSLETKIRCRQLLPGSSSEDTVLKTVN